MEVNTSPWESIEWWKSEVQTTIHNNGREIRIQCLKKHGNIWTESLKMVPAPADSWEAPLFFPDIKAIAKLLIHGWFHRLNGHLHHVTGFWIIRVTWKLRWKRWWPRGNFSRIQRHWNWNKTIEFHDRFLVVAVIVIGAVVLLVWCGCQNSKERA